MTDAIINAILPTHDNQPRWMRQPKGQRYPYAAGRPCERCGGELSRYNPGPECWHCETPQIDAEPVTHTSEAAA